MTAQDVLERIWTQKQSLVREYHTEGGETEIVFTMQDECIDGEICNSLIANKFIYAMESIYSDGFESGEEWGNVITVYNITDMGKMAVLRDRRRQISQNYKTNNPTTAL